MPGVRERVSVGARGPTPGLVLLVDDEPDFLATLRSLILRLDGGTTVDTAADGTQALARLAQAQPDLILCDYRMPDMDGLELLRRSVGLAPHAKRWLMTAFADSQLSETASPHVDGFLQKADLPARLRDQLATALAKVA